jgi:hypothetical protein
MYVAGKDERLESAPEEDSQWATPSRISQMQQWRRASLLLPLPLPLPLVLPLPAAGGAAVKNHRCTSADCEILWRSQLGLDPWIGVCIAQALRKSRRDLVSGIWVGLAAGSVSLGATSSR